jgi:SMODS and SLOG-associating 2TM effector domain family 5
MIGLSLVPSILSLQHYQSQILLACSIILSVFVIFTSLIDGSQNFYHQGELLHQCARKIAAINHKLKNIDSSKDEKAAAKELEQLQREYQIALDECPINHENVDYFKEVVNKQTTFISKLLPMGEKIYSPFCIQVESICAQ